MKNLHNKRKFKKLFVIHNSYLRRLGRYSENSDKTIKLWKGYYKSFNIMSNIEFCSYLNKCYSGLFK